MCKAFLLAATVLVMTFAWFPQDKPVAAPAQKGKMQVSIPKYLPPKGYVCYRATGPVTIDGKLDDEAWKSAPWTDDFVDIEGDLKPKPRFRTRVKMLWDDEFFYVAAEMEEPHVWGTLTKHDSVIFQDNDFEVFIDPNGDNHEYYEFEINALNTGWDLFLPKPYRDGGPAMDAWEIPGLKTAVNIQGTLNDPSDKDKGWTVEIAFPWNVLKEAAHRAAPPKEGDQWRVNFSRVEWLHEVIGGKYRKVKGTKEDNWVWSPQHVIDMHRPETWGYVQFSRGKAGGVKFIPDPTGEARHLLHQVYYRQADFKKKQKRWGKTLGELGLGELSTVRLQVTDSLYEASVPVNSDTGKRRVYIRQDSLVWDTANPG
ncbi:MAG TPA: carbohydrate-binding family 9-like protein [Gemmataceae bacterium]|nr:carbohydrate-binding family 9-like protein [Gemmataceae bacterium]